MSYPLFKADIRAHRGIWIAMALVFCFYFAVMMTLFDPEGAQNLEAMLKMMPETMIRALGFTQIGTTLIGFLASTMYGFLVFAFPMILSVVVNHGIVAAHVDRGSMAYLLATPNSRRKIAGTQALFSLASITTFFGAVTILGSLLAQVMFPGELAIGQFVLVNIYALLMYYAIGGIGFFASCIANESRASLTPGIGLPVLFLVLQLLGGASDTLAWIGNLSLYALFDPVQLIEGSSFAYVGMLASAVIAAVLYGSGITIFARRDLHV